MYVLVQRKLAGLLPGVAELGLCPMRALVVGSLGSHMHAPMAMSSLVSLDRILVVVCGVILYIDSTPRGL